MDMEFDKIKAIFPQFNINTNTAWEHVAEVQQKIRVLKERCHGILFTLPFKQVPNIIIIHLMQFGTMWLNAFSGKNEISNEKPT